MMRRGDLSMAEGAAMLEIVKAKHLGLCAKPLFVAEDQFETSFMKNCFPCHFYP